MIKQPNNKKKTDKVIFKKNLLLERGAYKL